ncbi:hypothetical protein PSY23_23745, partial [Shigella flexneri]|nr:hypothetical protein [Shigella flexneri]
ITTGISISDLLVVVMKKSTADTDTCCGFLHHNNQQIADTDTCCGFLHHNRYQYQRFAGCCDEEIHS